jgi:hypothetical protein
MSSTMKPRRRLGPVSLVGELQLMAACVLETVPPTYPIPPVVSGARRFLTGRKAPVATVELKKLSVDQTVLRLGRALR